MSRILNRLERSAGGARPAVAGTGVADKFQFGLGWTLLATILVNLGYAFLLLWV